MVNRNILISGEAGLLALIWLEDLSRGIQMIHN